MNEAEPRISGVGSCRVDIGSDTAPVSTEDDMIRLKGFKRLQGEKVFTGDARQKHNRENCLLIRTVFMVLQRGRWCCCAMPRLWTCLSWMVLRCHSKDKLVAVRLRIPKSSYRKPVSRETGWINNQNYPCITFTVSCNEN